MYTNNNGSHPTDDITGRDNQLPPQSPPDSWSLCDSCRLLAHALIGPQNHHAQHTLCLMMETHLKALQAALNLPIPEHHQPIALPAA